MAQGTATVFDEFLPFMNNGAATVDAAAVNLDADVFKIKLSSIAIGSIPASYATPNESDFTEVSPAGGGYTAGGATATLTVAEAGGTLTVSLASNVVWTSAGSGGPTDIKTAILYSTTHTGSNDAVCVIDLTDDGTTALDLNTGDITINAGTLFTIA